MRHLLISIGLAALTAAVYFQVVDHAFVDIDDHRYITENPRLREPISIASIATHFAEPWEANWIPLTWLSLHVDYHLYGLEPAGYLLTNAALHILATVLLYLALVRMTGAAWRSAFVAGVFAVHPLHVESVAWASERKDVLSGVFFALCLGAYALYAERRTALRAAAVAVSLGLGLLAKPMLVTVPFLLLLLDHWPLGRLHAGGRALDPGRLRAAVLEKLPLLALVAFSAWQTLRAQRAFGSVQDVGALPVGARVANALHSTAVYLGDAVWPTGLAAFYPHLGADLPAWQVAGAAALLVAISAAALRLAVSRPYLIVGWLWYLGMLVPVLGLVQVGMQARADRYMYLPLIGISIAVAWGAFDLILAGRDTTRERRVGLAAAGGFAIAALAALAYAQVATWRDPIALNGHAIAVTRDNFTSHYGLATALFRADRIGDALPHFEEAIRLKPEWANPHLGLADAHAVQDRWQEAAAEYAIGLRLDPSHARGHANYGQALMRLEKPAEARTHLERALALRAASELVRDHSANADFGLADVLLQTGEYADALRQYERGLAIEPDRVGAHLGAAIAASELGRTRDAVRHMREALRASPERPDIANNLAWVLATNADASVRDPADAVRFAERAAAATGESVIPVLDTLAAAYAAAGRFDDAIRTASRAQTLATDRGEPALAEDIGRHLALYRAGRPLVEDGSH